MLLNVLKENLLDKVIDIFTKSNGELTLAGKIVFGIAVYLIAKITISFIVRFVDNLLNRKYPFSIDHKRALTIGKLFKNIITVVVYFIGFTMILESFGINTGSIIATAGIGGVALAFGAQSLVKDAIQGVTMLLEKSIEVGDVVEVDSIKGTVAEIGLRRTIIEDYDGSVHIVPNGNISRIKNYSRKNLKADILVPVSYDEDINEIRAVVEAVSEKIKDDDRIVIPPTFVGIDKMESSGYTILISSEATNGNNFAIQRKVREMIYEEFKNRNIEFAKVNLKESK